MTTHAYYEAADMQTFNFDIITSTTVQSPFSEFYGWAKWQSNKLRNEI